jgi:hypothetical protein
MGVQFSKWRAYVYPIIIAALAVAACALTIWVLFGSGKAEHIVLFGAISAMTGWFISADIARRNSKKQHTMAVLTQVRISTEMNSRIKALYSVYPIGRSLSEPDTEKSEKEQTDALAAARYVLNYYEFLAVALRHGDLDHDLLKDCIRGQLCDFVDKARVVIDNHREQDPQKPSRRYSELLALYAKWKIA